MSLNTLDGWLEMRTNSAFCHFTTIITSLYLNLFDLITLYCFICLQWHHVMPLPLPVIIDCFLLFSLYVFGFTAMTSSIYCNRDLPELCF